MKLNQLNTILVLAAVLMFVACGSGSDGLDNPSLSENAIHSDFACLEDADCVFTGFRNTPELFEDCECPVGCVGRLVNAAENQKREDAYAAVCGGFPPQFQPCPNYSCAKVCYQEACEQQKCVAREVECDS